MTSTDSHSTEIFTCGACAGLRGRGGWAVAFYTDGKRGIVSGNDRSTTANRMELTAAIRGLLATRECQKVTVYSDCQYLVNTMTRGGERNSNLDLWAQLDQLQKTRNIVWKWLGSNRISPGKEIANRVATMEAGLFQTRDESRSGRRTLSGHGKAWHRRPTGGKHAGNNTQRPGRS